MPSANTHLQKFAASFFRLPAMISLLVKIACFCNIYFKQGKLLASLKG